MSDEISRWIDKLFRARRYTKRLDPEVDPAAIKLLQETLGLTEQQIRQLLWRVSEQLSFAVILYAQVLVAAAIWWWCSRWEVWWSASILAVVTYVAGATFIDTRLWRQIRSLRLVNIGTGLWWLMWIGVFTLSMVPLLLSWVLLQRLDVHSGVTVLVLFLLVVFAVLLWLAGWSAQRAGRAPWVAIGLAAVLLPLGVSWVSWSMPGWLFSLISPLASLQRPVQVNQERTPCPKPRTWAVNGKEYRVALALSGGGYRAAITHAGLLAAFDEQKIPLAYLTTVSGGSIIGASYALGVTPSRFASKLLEGKPGLPHDLFNLVSFTRSVLSTNFNSADAYSAHFQRVFFGTTQLSDLPSSPILLINATDLEAQGTEARAIFFRGNPALDQQTKIAELVAASGAFPVAFQPKLISWLENPMKARANRKKKFVDGGVVENLGVDGLMRYLEFECPSAPAPDVLVISDASHRGGMKRYKSKVEATALALRAEEMSYDSLHRHLYARYTGRPDFARWLLDHKNRPHTQISTVSYSTIATRSSATGIVRTVVVPVTAEETGEMLGQPPYSQCRFNQDPPYSPSPPQHQVKSPTLKRSATRFCEAHQPDPNTLAGAFCSVSQFDTLQELSAIQVRRGFWLGYHLGKIYAEAIKCAASFTSDPDSECSATQTSPQNFCQSVENILDKGISK